MPKEACSKSKEACKIELQHEASKRLKRGLHHVRSGLKRGLEHVTRGPYIYIYIHTYVYTYRHTYIHILYIYI
jgi:hypothetical protein